MRILHRAKVDLIIQETNHMLAAYLGHEIKESFTGTDGVIVPKRYIASFYGLEGKDIIQFSFRNELPPVLASIDEPDVMEVVVGDLDYTWQSAARGAYRRQYGEFKDIALLTLTKAAAKAK